MDLNELKSHLWDAANTLRGSAVDRTDWKGYILPLLFFKRISDVWDEETSEAAELYGDADPQAVLMATGSEVALVMDAAKELQADGIKVSVVSIPNLGLFADQEAEYRDTVLPPSVKCRMAVEAGVGNGWYAFVGAEGSVLSIDHYGESAPAPLLFEKFGFTTERVVSTVKELLAAT